MARKIIPLKREKYEPKLSRAEQSQRANRTILRRTLVLMVLFVVVVFIPLIVTLYNLMIRDHDYYEAQAIDNQTRYTSLSASRGQIFDRNMNVLASSKTVETVFIDPNEIAQEMTKPENSNLLDHIARGLSEILDVSTDFVYKQAEDKAFRYKVIRRKIQRIRDPHGLVPQNRVAKEEFPDGGCRNPALSGEFFLGQFPLFHDLT